MSDEKKQELKPCPCCKSDYVGRVRDEKVFIGQIYSGRYPAVVARQNHGFQNKCHKCGLATCWWHYQAEADEAWNTRADSKPEGDLITIEQSEYIGMMQAKTGLEAEVERLKAELSKFQMSEFHPDWSLLEAANGAILEHRKAHEETAKELDEYKRLLGVALRTFRQQIEGNWTNRKSMAVIACEGINDQLKEMSNKPNTNTQTEEAHNASRNI